MAISPARARRERGALLRSIDREIRAKNRARLLALRGEVRAARAAQQSAIAASRTRCAAKRELPTQRQVIAWQREMKASASKSCRESKDAARRLGDARARAGAIARAEHKEQRELRAIERSVARKLKSRPGLRRAVARAESDDEVRANIPPELVLLFERVKRSIKASDRMSRTDAFLHYAYEHPDEELAATEDKTDDVIRELERRQAMGNPKNKRNPKPKRGSLRFHVRSKGKAVKRGRRVEFTQAEAKRIAKRLRAEGKPAHVAPRGKPARKKNPPRLSAQQSKKRFAQLKKAGCHPKRVRLPSGESVVVRRAKCAAPPMRRNPRRPPKRWFDRCLRSVAAKKYARDPAAVCAAAWWRRPPAERERIVRRLERGSHRERRTAVAIAKAEKSRADGPRRRNPGMTDAEARAEYERTHWGDRGRDRVRRGRAADPTRGTATELGELVSVVYRTHKKERVHGAWGRRDKRVDWEHEFERSRPRLAYNEGGLLVVGGDYRIKAGGITG